MAASGSFSSAFSNAFDLYSSGVGGTTLSPALLSYYWVNDFNKLQETYITWNK